MIGIMDEDDIENVVTTIEESIGVLDEHGYYVCPFCQSYAKEQKNIRHNPDCTLLSFTRSIASKKVLTQSRINNILSRLDDIESTADDIKNSTDEIRDEIDRS